MARKEINWNRAGANFELKIMHDLERYGYLTLRSSGSRGAVDVVAVGQSSTLVIQAKISQPVIPPAERRAVLALADRMGPSAVPLVAYREAGKVGYRLLTGPGPKDWTLWEPEPLWFAVCALCGHQLRAHDPVQAEGCWETETGSKYSCVCDGFQLMS